MYLFTLVCCSMVLASESAPFIGKLSNVGNAVRNIGASLFNKLSGGVPPPLPSEVAGGDILTQLEFMLQMLRQVRGFMMSPSPLIREKMKPFTQTLVDEVIPHFEQLKFTDDELKATYKLKSEDILKFRQVLTDTVAELKAMSSTMNKQPKEKC